MNAVQKTTPHNGEPDYPWSVKAPAIVLSGFFVGPIGSSILRMFSVELQEFDVLKSACVGALGALVYALVYFAMEPAIPPLGSHSQSSKIRWDGIGAVRAAPRRANEAGLGCNYLKRLFEMLVERQRWLNV